MSLPTNVGSGRIVGRYVVGVIDSPDDTDDEPELIPARGTITFTPSIGYVPNSTTEIPMTIMKAPITGVLDSEGYLCTPDNTNTPAGGLTRGIKLFATDVGQVTGWTYSVKYSFTPVGTVSPHIPDHTLTVPDKSTQDLTKVAPTPYAPVIGIPQMEAAVLRAEAAAQSVVDRANSGEFIGDTGPATTLSIGSVEFIEGSALDSEVIDAQISTEGTVANDALIREAEKAVLEVFTSPGQVQDLITDVVATDISDPQTPIGSALSTAIADSRSIGFRPEWATVNASYDNLLDAYNLRPDNLPKWRAARAKASAGLGQAHVSTFLDSITHGANTATSNPKYVNSWPGRMARQLKTQLGDGGTGIVIPWDSMPNTAGNPPHDNRFTFAGNVTDVSYGIYSRGAKRVAGADGELNHIEFTATCDEFWVYSITSVTGALPRIQIDGGEIKTIAGTAVSTTPDYPPQPGYWGTVAGTGNGQIVSRIPVTLGQHTIRLMAPSTSGSLTLLGVEGRIAGKGVRVSNLAQSSRSMADMMLDDTAHHMSGLSVALDMPKSDLAVMLLGMNDYQGHSATFKSRVSAAIDRQRDGGTYGAHGDVILVTCPQPNYAAPIPSDGILTPPLADYYNDLYELADEKDVPLIDVARRWRNFETSNALGFFGDSLHPNDLGSEDIARAVYNALMAV